MNIHPDFESTRRRETLRTYQDWLRKDSPGTFDAYRREKDADTGSPLPALLLLAAVCAVAWLWLAVR